GGTTLTLAQLAALGTTPVTVDTGEGLLALTGFTATSNVGGIPTAGTLAYTYTLKARLDHTGAVDSTDPIALSVLDAGGGTSTGTLTVRIVDDVPTANADANSVSEGTTTATTSTSGNVFGSTGASASDSTDRIGADTTATPVTAVSFGATAGTVGSALAGAYGALTLNA
ncbi:MAG: hypothetical protein JNM70_27335, partial [Anaerolineae bacterium]|nr:hypothetical protein [Anaerolineae bacterium]